jgi:hypothetical protein
MESKLPAMASPEGKMDPDTFQPASVSMPFVVAVALRFVDLSEDSLFVLCLPSCVPFVEWNPSVVMTCQGVNTPTVAVTIKAKQAAFIMMCSTPFGVTLVVTDPIVLCA